MSTARESNFTENLMRNGQPMTDSVSCASPAKLRPRVNTAPIALHDSTQLAHQVASPQYRRASGVGFSIGANMAPLSNVPRDSSSVNVATRIQRQYPNMASSSACPRSSGVVHPCNVARAGSPPCSAAACETPTNYRRPPPAWPPTLIRNVFAHKRIQSDHGMQAPRTSVAPPASRTPVHASMTQPLVASPRAYSARTQPAVPMFRTSLTHVPILQSVSNSSLARTSTACTTVRSCDANTCSNQSPRSILPLRARLSSFQSNNAPSTDSKMTSHGPFVLPQSFIQEAVDLVSEEHPEDPASESPSLQQSVNERPATPTPSGSHPAVPAPLMDKNASVTPLGRQLRSRAVPSRQQTQPALGAANVRSSSIGGFGHPMRFFPHRVPAPPPEKVDVGRALPRTHSAGRFGPTPCITRGPQGAGRSDYAIRPQTTARGSSIGPQTGGRFVPPARPVQSARDSRGVQRRPSGTSPVCPTPTKNPLTGDPASSVAPNTPATPAEPTRQSSTTPNAPFVGPQSRLFAHARLSNKVANAPLRRGPIKAFASPTIALESPQTLTVAKALTADSVQARQRHDSPAKTPITTDRKLVRPGQKQPHDDTTTPAESIPSAHPMSARRAGTWGTPSPTTSEPSYAASTVASKSRSDEVRRDAKRMSARQGSVANELPKPQVQEAKQRTAQRVFVPCSDVKNKPPDDRDQTATTRPTKPVPILPLKTDRRQKNRDTHTMDQQQRQQQREQLLQRYQQQQREQQPQSAQQTPDAIQFAPVLSRRPLAMRRMTLTNLAVRGVIPTAAGPKNALVRRSGSTVTISRHRYATDDETIKESQPSAPAAAPPLGSSSNLSTNQAPTEPQYPAVSPPALSTPQLHPPKNISFLPRSHTNRSSAENCTAPVDRTPPAAPYSAFELMTPLDHMLTTILSQNLPSPTLGSPASQGALSVLSSPLVPPSPPGVPAGDAFCAAASVADELEVTMQCAIPTPTGPKDATLDASIRTRESLREEEKVSRVPAEQEKTVRTSPAREMDNVSEIVLPKTPRAEETQLSVGNLEQSISAPLTAQLDGEKNVGTVRTLSPRENAAKNTQVSSSAHVHAGDADLDVFVASPKSPTTEAQFVPPEDLQENIRTSPSAQGVTETDVKSLTQKAHEERLDATSHATASPAVDKGAKATCFLPNRNDAALQSLAHTNDVPVATTTAHAFSPFKEQASACVHSPASIHELKSSVCDKTIASSLRRRDLPSETAATAVPPSILSPSIPTSVPICPMTPVTSGGIDGMSQASSAKVEGESPGDKLSLWYETLGEEPLFEAPVDEEPLLEESLEEEELVDVSLEEEPLVDASVNEEPPPSESPNKQLGQGVDLGQQDGAVREVEDRAAECGAEEQNGPGGEEEHFSLECAAEKSQEDEEQQGEEHIAEEEENEEKNEEEPEGDEDDASNASSDSESVGDVSPSELAPLAIDPAVWAFMESRYKTTGLWAVSKSHPSASSDEIQVLTDIFDQEWETHSTWKSDPEELETSVRYSLRNGGEQVCVVISDIFCQGMSKFVTLKREGICVTIFWPCSLRLQRIIKR
eukprot:GEMP01000184.1.p1 GENE.GEMP01000184.1~~GEMP01000184.1.p1  ORF type:complete len:1560 (+),score=342.45 GEMP01000184.1:2158-6837(+)